MDEDGGRGQARARGGSNATNDQLKTAEERREERTSEGRGPSTYLESGM